MPSSVLNGRIVRTKDTFQGVALYICDEGYDLIGDEVRLCQDNLTWTGDDPFCRGEECCTILQSVTALLMAHIAQFPLLPSVRECGSPPDILNGMRVFTEITYLSTATYSCNTGYNLRGPNELTCESNTVWTPTRRSDRYYHNTTFCQSMYLQWHTLGCSSI